METLPDFATAVHRFQEFLREQKLSDNLMWVWREDVMFWRRQLYVKLPLPPENETSARMTYGEGKNLGFGVCLAAFCLLEGIPCCHVWFARDAEDGSRHMCSGLKLSIPTPLRMARPVRNRFRWSAMNRLSARKESIAWDGSLANRPYDTPPRK